MRAVAAALVCVACACSRSEPRRPTTIELTSIHDPIGPGRIAPVLPKLRVDRAPLVLGGAATWASAHDVGAMRFCPGDKELISVEDGGALRRYRVDDGAEIAATPSLTGPTQARGETVVDCRADGVALTIDAAKSPVLVDAKGAITRPPSEIEAFHAQFAADGSVWAQGDAVSSWNGAKVTEVVPPKAHVLYQNLGEGAVYVEQIYNSGNPANDGVWMLRDGVRIKLPGPSGGLDQISVAPDGAIAIADMMVAHTWTVKGTTAGNRALLLDQSGFHIKSVAATNKWFIAVDAGGDLVIVARPSGKKTTLANPCSQPDHYYESMAVAHDDKRVAIACSEIGVRIFDVATRKQLSTDGITSAANGIAWSTDGQELEARQDRGPTRIWRDGKLARTLPAAEPPPPRISASRTMTDVDQIVIARDGAQKTIDLPVTKVSWISNVAIDPSGTHALVARGRYSNEPASELVEVDLATGTSTVASVTSSAIALGDGFAIIADPSGSISRRVDGKMTPIGAHGDRVTTLVLTADVIAAGGEDGAISLWAIPTGATLGSLTGHSSAIRALAFAPDGRHLASTAGDATLIWDLTP